MIKKILCTFILLIPVFILVLDCESSTEPENNMPQNGENIEVTYPIGGETFYIGDTITITFKVNADSIEGVLPRISIDSGKSWPEITVEQITPPGSGGQHIPYIWTIGEEIGEVDYKDTNPVCIIKIQNYNDSKEFDKSGMFTIIKP